MKENIYGQIDPAINNKENEFHYKYLTSTKKISIERFDNIDDGYKYLIKEENEFKEIVIIISGKLFNDLYYLIKKNIESINFSPSIIIFTSKKDLLINQLKLNNTYYNNNLFDTRLIFANPSMIEDYIDDIMQEESDLTFDIIDNLDQLIVPNYYTYLLEDVNIPEINNFNDYLLKNFVNKGINPNEEINKLLKQIKYKILPKEILIKYWIRIYTLESEFFKILNKSLRTKDNNNYYYYPFIKLCYEGIRKGFLKPYIKEIYRCSKISIDEFKEIQEIYNSKKNNIKYPNLIVFSRSFLSFSTEKNMAEGFKRPNNNTYSILYIIQEIKNINNIDKKVSNTLIETISKIPDEKEALVFPFSCFEIINIKKIEKNGIDYEIHLKYLGNYTQYIEEQLGNNFFDKIQISKFSEELIDCKILKINNFFSS